MFYGKMHLQENGDAVKSYLAEAHITTCVSIKVTAQTPLDNMAKDTRMIPCH